MITRLLKKRRKVKLKRRTRSEIVLTHSILYPKYLTAKLQATTGQAL